MAPDQADKRVNFLQYINTGLLTFISVIVTIAASMLVSVKNDQVAADMKMVKLETIQNNNVNNVASVSTRVSTLESNFVENIKNWVDQNYIRKPQK